MEERDIRGIKVREILHEEWPVLEPGHTVDDTIRLFVGRNIPGAPVADEGRLVGIVTEGDLIFRDVDVEAPGVFDLLGGMVPLGSWAEYRRELKKSTAVTVDQVMTTEVVTVSPDQTISDVATLMAEQRKRILPVVEDGRPVGVVTRADILALHVIDLKP